ncbi:MULTISPECIES: NAD(P)/FAD-dependent oxidoreductase [Mammaliicoccus]|uniref:NAD(P)/FAD-dependent oxidoreductase n=1 Tax=Mammaliicoccus fleurettii TaxID=150056 RepID=A0ABS5MMD3_9STAP|nr:MULTISPECIES: NAD(P)/FAD-dependent oxidoreductase [Mammaliicoccus]MBL0847333.1 NAD(P)/FAD-dependent oxidoreductase [Mammaliicoccus fleurettii]MBO3063414.1 NAD(P)/FAD-dependent oxidoreductase [Mammaliicoccus fleurettii]MBS3672248.1 NAD(P)/FAD-dependent oxidoreductase [Mammaliicoccus fleurettii]MBS3697083.1 NAD(P)/FAD-dependent oxidoreductase [Mammaliicoccus fleurettii]MBW0764744.1 NAD(P)/FAD-dependent oxidoreductase [Mammaliicoccus fleurettii]
MFDCIVIGGGPAGLASALTLGRALKKTLVIDNNNARNKVTRKSHAFLTQDGVTPEELRAKAEHDVDQYKDVSRVNDTVVKLIKENDHFIVETKQQKYTTKKVMICTGLRETLPDIKGLKESYGKSIFYCPWCDGYELKNKSLLISVQPEQVKHMALLLSNWSEDIVISSKDFSVLTAEDKAFMDKKKIKLIESEVTEFKHSDGNINEVVFENGERIPRSGALIGVKWDTDFEFLNGLNIEREENGKIKIEQFGETSVPGLFVAGESKDTMASQLIDAAANGNQIAKFVAMQIIMESN